MTYTSHRTPQLDRSEISRALAKAIAYHQCGKPEQAARWAAHLVDLLACAEILTDRGRALAMEV